MRLKTSFSICIVKMLRSSSGLGEVSIGVRCARAGAAMRIASAKTKMGLPGIAAQRGGAAKVPSMYVCGRLRMPKMLAPARDDQQGEADADQAVQRAGRGEAC